jgi:hypothetical protein
MLDHSHDVCPSSKLVVQRVEATLTLRDRIGSIVLGTVLFAAAAFKAHALLTGNGTNSLLPHRWMEVVVIVFEALLGTALVLRRLGGTTRIAVGWFALLFGISFYRLISGYDSCGCFGNFEVPPLLTVLFNGAALCWLVYFEKADFLRHRAEEAPAGAYRRVVLPLLPVLLIAWVGFAVGAIMASGPASDFESGGSVRRVTFEADSVPLYGKVKHTFSIKNDTDRLLRILEVKKSCGCTEAIVDKKELGSGDSANVSVSVAVGGRVTGGMQTVLLETDSPVLRRFQLDLRYRVQPPNWAVVPRQVRFGRQVVGATPARTVELSTGSGAEIVEVTSVESWHRSEILPTDKPGVFKLSVQILPTSESGVQEGRVRVITTDKETPELFIPVFATVEENVYVEPPVVSFGFLRPGERREAIVRLCERVNRGCKLLRNEVTDSQIVVSELELDSDSSKGTSCLARLKIVFEPAADKRTTGFHRELVSIKTTDEQTPEIAIPVSYYLSK